MAQICAMPGIARRLDAESVPGQSKVGDGPGVAAPNGFAGRRPRVSGRAPLQKSDSSGWRRDQARLDLAAGAASKSKVAQPCVTWRTLPNPEWRIGTASEVAAARWNRLAEALARRPPV